MAYDLDEQEQIDSLKAWWSRYGVMVLAVVFIAAAAFAGFRGWQWYQHSKGMQAMGYFEALELAVQNPGPDSAARIAAASESLRTEFAGSGYAARGGLVAADGLMALQDADGARRELEWVAVSSGDQALAPVARLRLAGLLLDQAKYDEALAQLANPPAAFAALYEDRRGDILFAQGKVEEAGKAWNQARAGLKENDPLIGYLKLKIDALSGGQS
ncbi:YfgM family protein [Kerstersia similis]|uniref:YfgM family protein n=1 Tax=Kerstersia similis TaxID=206505 RepID=UPI0039F071E5